MNKEELANITVSKLKEIAKQKGIPKAYKYKKEELINLIVNINDDENSKNNDKEDKDIYSNLKDPIENSFYLEGIVHILPEGFGLLKNEQGLSPADDVYVAASQVQKFKLQSGDKIGGKIRKAKNGEKYNAMLFLEKVNGKATKDILRKEKEVLNASNKKDLSQYEISHEGILDILSDGYGFLRTYNYLNGDNDIYVAPTHIRKYKLREGDLIKGKIKLSSENDKFDALLYVEEVNGRKPEEIISRPDFEKLTPIFPNEKIKLETYDDTLSTRIIDIFSPIGKGQRGLIVAAPKAGKTILLKQIAKSIRKNYPKIKLIVLLIDERPEEVTDMSRSIDCDVVYSTFDQMPQNHIKAAQMVLQRAKRLVELKEDVVILVDSLTRFTRANNLVVPPSGRTLSGGLDPESLYLPKKFFGAARNIEEGGSLTILSTVLVDTGSRMDDVIFEEFKGTGNMELILERDLALRRTFPAINLVKSGSRKDELLLEKDEIKTATIIRRSSLDSIELSDKTINLFKKTKNNNSFIKNILNNKAK